MRWLSFFCNVTCKISCRSSSYLSDLTPLFGLLLCRWQTTLHLLSVSVCVKWVSSQWLREHGKWVPSQKVQLKKGKLWWWGWGEANVVKIRWGWRGLCWGWDLRLKWGWSEAEVMKLEQGSDKAEELRWLRKHGKWSEAEVRLGWWSWGKAQIRLRKGDDWESMANGCHLSDKRAGLS